MLLGSSSLQSGFIAQGGGGGERGFRFSGRKGVLSFIF